MLPSCEARRFPAFKPLGLCHVEMSRREDEHGTCDGSSNDKARWRQRRAHGARSRARAASRGRPRCLPGETLRPTGPSPPSGCTKPRPRPPPGTGSRPEASIPARSTSQPGAPLGVSLLPLDTLGKPGPSEAFGPGSFDPRRKRGARRSSGYLEGVAETEAPCGEQGSGAAACWSGRLCVG